MANCCLHQLTPIHSKTNMAMLNYPTVYVHEFADESAADGHIIHCRAVTLSNKWHFFCLVWGNARRAFYACEPSGMGGQSIIGFIYTQALDISVRPTEAWRESVG